MNDTLAAFIRQHQIHEIECVIPDMTGVARGKIVPKNLFLAEDSMKMSKAVLTITVNGEFAEFERFAGANDPDMVCRPDPATIRLVPWAIEPVAVVIHDCEDFDGTPVGISPIHTHHMPALWTRPQQFDPERFSPERAEHRRHAYAYLPFGGGAHLCIGQHFADMEVKAVMHQVLRRWRWSVPAGYRMPYQLVPIAKPRDGLPIMLERC